MSRSTELTKEFHLIIQEMNLAHSCISIGLNELVKSNIASEKGRFYSAFFQLSIGIERMMKIAISVDGLLNNSHKRLSKHGHNLASLYSECIEIAKNYDLVIGQWHENETNKEILAFLSDFATSTRYYNLNEMFSTADSDKVDPLVRWNNIINRILKEEISEERIELELQRSSLLHSFLENSISALHHDLDRTELVGEALFQRPTLIAICNPHIVWRLVLFLREIRELLVSLDEYSKRPTDNMNRPVIPYLRDFFQFLLHDRKSVLKKKKWP